VTALADDDVVVDPQAQEPPALHELAREVDVLLRRRRVARGVVVDQDQVGRRLEDGRAEDLARVDDGGREAALRDLDVPQEPVLAVEERDLKDLLL
jgi:hypothetical protein